MQAVKQRIFAAVALVASGLVGVAIGSHHGLASDHDDGSAASADKTVNLTDLLVYNEKDQNAAITTNDLIFQMNVNPRVAAKADAAFNTNARYEFHVTRVGTATANGTAPTGKEDVLMRYEFAAPDTDLQQAITLTVVADGKTTSLPAGKTTAFKNAATPTKTAVAMGTSNVTVFAGVREDTFFFDVEQFLKVRDTAVKRAKGDTVAQAVFRKPGVDFTKNLNVLSIIARVPRELLAGTSGATTFDVWETASVKM
ncbi:MAG: hypothetical protein JWM80_331 [Cyanobacteria bacterium RYN_339]|nr:hypothetical protein [Cyanobacteria bacterium RYN_339]